MNNSLLSRGKIKTRDAETLVFAFLKMILYRHIGYYLQFERQNGGGVVVDVTSCSLHHARQFADHGIT